MAVEKDITVEPVGDFALKGIRRPLRFWPKTDACEVNPLGHPGQKLI
jgi:hypothetical protein